MNMPFKILLSENFVTYFLQIMFFIVINRNEDDAII